jgi:hypothetical protein
MKTRAPARTLTETGTVLGTRAQTRSATRTGSRARAVAASVALAAVWLSSSGTSWAASRAAATGDREALLATPLATSVQAGRGTWATVPMGNLGQPLNTFWQLFYRADGSTSWSDKVQATAVATNGGLVLATGGASLSVGIRPSHLLTFSPIISTVDSGRSWSNGLLTEGLAAHPEALATGPGGAALAIVDSRRGTEVLKSSHGLSSWQPLVSTDALSSSPSARACGLRALTAVGYASNTVVVGGSCDRAGETGIFVQQGTAWHSTGPVLPSRLESAQTTGTEVLGLLPLHPGAGLGALLAVSDANGIFLVASWTRNGTTWRASKPLRLAGGEQLASFGADDNNGAFALVALPDGRKQLAVADTGSSGSSAWHELSAPPPGTQTVAFGPGRNAAALAVSSTVLSVWALSPGWMKWQKDQVMNVPVQLGSSS